MSEMDGASGVPTTPDPEPSTTTDAAPEIAATRRHAAATEPEKISRRLLLGSAGGLALAAVAGVGLGWSRNLGHGDRFDRRRELPDPPVALVRAAQREERLIATAQAALSGSGGLDATVLTAILADHQAHSTALRGALAGYRDPAASAAPGSAAAASVTSSVATPTVVELRTLEASAQSDAAQDSLALSGAAAALLASISACEATHLVLLA